MGVIYNFRVFSGARLFHRIRVTVLMLCLLAPGVGFALAPINSTYFGSKAIEGYDVVAYFAEAKAVPGSRKFSYRWMDANWFFSSEKNRRLFQQDPEKYLPQYGGYCAYAVAKNTTAGIDPTQFTIVDGKLYLNYNKKIQRKWLADRDIFIERADSNWPGLLQ